MMSKARIFKNISLLILLSFLFFMVGNNLVNLTNPDEVFYAQTAKEMITHKTWIVPYLFDQPQFEKPIFTYWLLRLGFAIFGVTNFAARFFPAFFAMIGVIAVYLLSLTFYNDEKKAFTCALILLSSALYIGLARTVFTDLIFSVLILLSLTSFFHGYTNRKSKSQGIVLFFVFSGLAVLTKGPLGFVIPVSVILLFLVIRKDLKFLFSKHSLWGLFIFTAIAIPWYLFMIKKFGNVFIQEFFYNDHIRRLFVAEHKTNDTWYFYPLSMTLGMFPWSIFMLAAFFYLFNKLKEKVPQPPYLFISCWILAVFIIFEVAHSKLVSYVFPLFPALAIIIGDFIYSMLNLKKFRFFILSLLSWCIFLLLPIAVIIATKKYPTYLPSKAMVYNYIYLYSALLAVMLWLILKRKLLLNFYLLVIQVPLILFLCLFLHTNFDSYVSSKNACSYLLNNYTVTNRILCSKSIVRGVRFFSDKDVAVLNIGGANFFSPHPIPFLNSDIQAKDFLSKQPVTYCILTRSSLEDLQRIAAAIGLKFDMLKDFGGAYIVRVQPSPYQRLH